MARAPALGHDGGTRHRRRRRPRWAAPLLALGAVAGLLAGTAPAGASPPAGPVAAPSLGWAVPHWAAGAQLSWLVSVAGRPPLPAATVRRHFAASFLATIPVTTVAGDLAALGGDGRWRVVTLDAGTSRELLLADVAAGSSRLGIDLHVDAAGRIDGLELTPAPAAAPTPTTWAAVNRQVGALAPEVGFEAATVTGTGRCQPVDAVSPSTPLPLGSMFKLYVLAAVAAQVATGRLRWDQQVALTADRRSLPSGLLQAEPDGTRYSVAHVAQQMMASSDNTAADMLAGLVGRTAVAAQVARTNSHAGLDDPFLTTRELFVLKYADYPRYADAYLARPVAGRLRYLEDVVDRVPLSAIDVAAAGTAGPRAIGSIEWFAAPAEVCAAMATLYDAARSPSLSPVSTALSTNDGGLALAPSTWPLVWFKGGSEAGVLTVGYLARSATGTVVVAMAQLADPTAPIDEATVVPPLLAAVRGAMALSQSSG